MAKSTFTAHIVATNARLRLKENEAQRTAKHESNIKEIMSLPRRRWEWRSLLPARVTYYLDREAAEKRYGMTSEYSRSQKYWTDLSYTSRQRYFEKLLKLALAAELNSTNSEVSLDADEAIALGLETER